MCSKNYLNEESTYELKKIVEMENKLNRNNLICKAGNKKKDKMYDFQMFERKRYFGRENYNNDLSLDDALEQQIRLKDDIDIFKDSTKPKVSVEKEKKIQTLKNKIILLNRRQKVLNTFESRIFPIRKQEEELANILACVARVSRFFDSKFSNRKQLKILTPKEMLQTLPITLKQVKVGNTSENLLK